MNIDRSQCPSCESKDSSIRIERSRIEYGVYLYTKNWPEYHPVYLPVSIPVTVPVRTCADCKLEWTDHHGEKRRDEAVAKYLASKSPSP